MAEAAALDVTHERAPECRGAVAQVGGGGPRRIVICIEMGIEQLDEFKRDMLCGLCRTAGGHGTRGQQRQDASRDAAGVG